jgi:hypothetical protein
MKTVSVGASSRSEDDLTQADRRQLEEALKELQAVVTASETANDPGAAQEAIDRAEEHLWELRERLLGWSRPLWAPRASLVGDWFSSDDAVYDEMTDPAAG